MAEYCEHSPLLDVVFSNADTIGDKVALVAKGEETTYRQLADRVRQAATFLNSKGVGARTRILLSAQKDAKFIFLYLGAHLLGATSVIVDAESNQERLRYIEKATTPSYCFGYLSEFVPSVLLEDIDLDGLMLWNKQAAGVTKEDVSEIMFTTGTTGNPKGVCLSYFNVYSSASNINAYIGNSREDIEVLGLPICHSFGLGRVRCNLLKGATIILLGSFANMRLFLKTIEEYHVTGFGVVPAAWQYIRKISGTRIAKYADQIRYIEIGSASMPMPVKVEMLQLFPNTRICMHYGLTEASRSTFQEFHDIDHLDSIGTPVCEKVDVAIFSPEGERLGYNKVGELCVKGNMVTKSYLLPQDNRDAFWGDFFRTGDCGYKAEDGFFYLVGREKEMINVGGKKVSPAEVEDAIVSLGVGDCICVGVADPDGFLGEVVKAYVLTGSTEQSFEQIAEGLKSKLEIYKQPVLYEWIDEIPVTASGKKQRVKLKYK